MGVDGSVEDLKDFLMTKKINLQRYGLKNLEELKFDMDSIREIPDFIFNMNKLKYLSFNFNGISYTPQDIQKLGNLLFLNYNNNNLIYVPDILENLKNIRNLSFADNELTDFVDLTNFKNLKAVNVERNKIPPKVILKMRK